MRHRGSWFGSKAPEQAVFPSEAPWLARADAGGMRLAIQAA
jgi:hypothetical protein